MPPLMITISKDLFTLLLATALALQGSVSKHAPDSVETSRGEWVSHQWLEENRHSAGAALWELGPEHKDLYIQAFGEGATELDDPFLTPSGHRITEWGEGVKRTWHPRDPSYPSAETLRQFIAQRKIPYAPGARARRSQDPMACDAAKAVEESFSFSAAQELQERTGFSYVGRVVSQNVGWLENGSPMQLIGLTRHSGTSETAADEALYLLLPNAKVRLHSGAFCTLVSGREPPNLEAGDHVVLTKPPSLPGSKLVEFWNDYVGLLPLEGFANMDQEAQRKALEEIGVMVQREPHPRTVVPGHGWSRPSGTGSAPTEL